MCKCPECVAIKRSDAIDESYDEFVAMVKKNEPHAVRDVLEHDEGAARRVIWLVLEGQFQEAKELAENMKIGAANSYAHNMNEREAA